MRLKLPSTRLDDWETSRFSGCLDYDDGVCCTHFLLFKASRVFWSLFATNLLSLGYDFSYVRACTIERRYPARYSSCPCITLLFRFGLPGHVMQRPGWVYLKKEVLGDTDTPAFDMLASRPSMTLLSAKNSFFAGISSSTFFISSSIQQRRLFSSLGPGSPTVSSASLNSLSIVLYWVLSRSLHSVTSVSGFFSSISRASSSKNSSSRVEGTGERMLQNVTRWIPTLVWGSEHAVRFGSLKYTGLLSHRVL